METCDVLIVGGGPAGSTCAWRLRQLGYDVVVIDKARFPRDKTCAGWIVPQVIESLQLDVADYSASHVWQPMTGFQIGLWDQPGKVVRFDRAVSYGIRRCEFDAYLLARSGARLHLGEAVHQIEQTDTGWEINGQFKAPLLIGAGGHFCPVARQLRVKHAFRASIVTAVEVEMPIAQQPIDQTLDGETPRLYFCDDLAGYGWCVRKQTVLNLGVGRVDARDVPFHWGQLLDRFRREQIVTGELSIPTHGHAYHIYQGETSAMIDDGVLLIGDAAGLADSRSGEGIRPAVESGLMAAATIHASRGHYDRARLQRYSAQIRQRFGSVASSSEAAKEPNAASPWRKYLLNCLFGSRWFSRHVILNRWFLHAQLKALQAM